MKDLMKTEIELLKMTRAGPMGLYSHLPKKGRRRHSLNYFVKLTRTRIYMGPKDEDGYYAELCHFFFNV